MSAYDIGGPSLKFLGRKRLDRGDIRDQENGVGNCDHFPTCLLNLVKFGPQTEKMGPFFNPPKINLFER